jgi:hypothetical protein
MKITELITQEATEREAWKLSVTYDCSWPSPAGHKRPVQSTAVLGVAF